MKYVGEVFWWAILGMDETFVLQFSFEARQFFPEILGTWQPPKALETQQKGKIKNASRKTKVENNFRRLENKNEKEALHGGQNV